MTTSVSDTQRLRGESTNGTMPTPETAERTRARPANQLDFLQAMRDFKYVSLSCSVNVRIVMHFTVYSL